MGLLKYSLYWDCYALSLVCLINHPEQQKFNETFKEDDIEKRGDPPRKNSIFTKAALFTYIFKRYLPVSNMVWLFCFVSYKLIMLQQIKITGLYLFKDDHYSEKVAVLFITFNWFNGIAWEDMELYISSTSQNWQFPGFRQNIGIFSLFIATLDNTNASNQGKWALLLLIWGNNETLFRKTSNISLPQPNFDDFHRSFHNLTLIFRKQCSHARSKCHFCSEPWIILLIL